MGMNINPIQQPGLGDVQSSTDNSIAAQEEMQQLQQFYKVKTSKHKSNSAIAKSLTAMFDECARRMA